MSTSKKYFDFCLRCLRAPSPPDQLIEHHLKGRGKDMYDVAYVCRDKCNRFVENKNGPVESESKILFEKKSLLITSPSLRWIIENHASVMNGFNVLNKNGPDLNFPNGYSGNFGAIGH